MPLLAHLRPYFRLKPEDIATYSLKYIISESLEINRSFTSFVSNLLEKDLSPTLNYSTQASGENQERPDISGVNTDGVEELLCEAKFYAGLTSNQPTEYLNRLQRNNGTGLLFICPSCRRQSLWGQLINLVSKRAIEKINDYCVSVDDIRMAVTTWDEILTILQKTAIASAKEYLSDIDQLDDFRKQEDKEAFIPFTLEELGPETARKEGRFSLIVDELISFLNNDKSLCPKIEKKVKLSSNSFGVSKWLYVRDFILTIYYDRSYWMDPTTSDTPFWCKIENKTGGQNESLLRSFKRYPRMDVLINKWGVYLALHPLVNATQDEVVKDLKKQVVCI